MKYKANIQSTLTNLMENDPNYLKEDVKDVADILCVTRSYLLLLFITNLSIVYQQVDESTTHVDLSKSIG